MKCPECGHVIQRNEGLKGKVFELHGQGLTVAEIVEVMSLAGFFEHYTSNPAIAVHTTLVNMSLTPHKTKPL